MALNLIRVCFSNNFKLASIAFSMLKICFESKNFLGTGLWCVLWPLTSIPSVLATPRPQARGRLRSRVFPDSCSHLRCLAIHTASANTAPYTVVWEGDRQEKWIYIQCNKKFWNLLFQSSISAFLHTIKDFLSQVNMVTVTFDCCEHSWRYVYSGPSQTWTPFYEIILSSLERYSSVRERITCLRGRYYIILECTKNHI